MKTELGIKNIYSDKIKHLSRYEKLDKVYNTKDFSNMAATLILWLFSRHMIGTIVEDCRKIQDFYPEITIYHEGKDITSEVLKERYEKAVQQILEYKVDLVADEVNEELYNFLLILEEKRIKEGNKSGNKTL